MKTWETLVRREFWENRSLWVAPLCAAVLMVISCIALVAHFGDLPGPGGGFRPRGNFNPGFGPGFGRGFDPEHDGFAIAVFVFAGLIMTVGSIAITTYVLDSLCAERKDRSILFWKSLPVSDAKTVLSKLLVALVVMPLALYVLVVATHLLCAGILSLNPPRGLTLTEMWQPGALLKAYAWLGGTVVVNALWYSPLVAYGLLASVLARRVPLMMAVLPPVLLGVGETWLLGTKTVWSWIFRRFMARVDIERALLGAELWLGVAVAVVLVLVVIRLRRWRDDS